MTSQKFSFLLPSLALALGLAACGGDDADETGAPSAPERPPVEQPDTKGPATTLPPSDGNCTEPNSLCATLELPANYASKPVKLLGALYDQLPPVGPPAKMLATVENPDIGVGKPLNIELKDLQIEGEYFIYMAVYSEGGGPFVPVPGVDYVAQTERKVKFDGSPINLGKITFHLEETP